MWICYKFTKTGGQREAPLGPHPGGPGLRNSPGNPRGGEQCRAPVFWLLPAHLALRPPGGSRGSALGGVTPPNDLEDTIRAPGCLEAAGAAPVGVRLKGGAEANPACSGQRRTGKQRARGRTPAEGRAPGVTAVRGPPGATGNQERPPQPGADDQAPAPQARRVTQARPEGPDRKSVV